MAKVKEVAVEKEEVGIAQVTLTTGEIIESITAEKFRGLALNQQAEALVKVKKLADFFRKLYNEFEPIVRTKMDFARNDATEINQVKVGEGVTVHLGAGKVDKELGVQEVEDFFNAWFELDPKGAKVCFQEIHKPVKSEITKFRKQKGEPGSMERKRSEMIEHFYNPQPKKLEIKEA